METEPNMAERKSRVVHQGAERKTEWRAVGSITIFAPELDAPLILDGANYIVFFKEAQRDGDLREAFVMLKCRRPVVDRALWLIVGVSIGMILLGIRMWLAR